VRPNTHQIIPPMWPSITPLPSILYKNLSPTCKCHIPNCNPLVRTRIRTPLRNRRRNQRYPRPLFSFPFQTPNSSHSLPVPPPPSLNTPYPQLSLSIPLPLLGDRIFITRRPVQCLGTCVPTCRRSRIIKCFWYLSHIALITELIDLLPPCFCP